MGLSRGAARQESRVASILYCGVTRLSETDSDGIPGTPAVSGFSSVKWRKSEADFKSAEDTAARGYSQNGMRLLSATSENLSAPPRSARRGS